MNLNYYIWIEIQANKRTIADTTKFQKEMEKCKQAGIGAVILSVKDTTGFTIYQSDIAPHYSEYDDVFEQEDYLLNCLEIVHGLGMKFYASVDVFAEGNKRKQHPLMPGIRNKEWQTYVYGINEANEIVIQPVAQETAIKTVGSIDDFGEIFVNPANDDVCVYELSLLDEIMRKYPIDGIALDRIRYVGLSSDFSPITKIKWDQCIGCDTDWPTDIYRIKKEGNDATIEYGKYFGEFVTFRAGIIRSFIEQVRNLVDKQQRKIEFWDYTGSWYPLYYQVGANWASESYEAKEYPWIDHENYKKTGYAEKLDGLLSGFYYPYVTEQDAKSANQPAYWYSVEGSSRLALTVTNNTVPIVGSLFLEQYRNNLESMSEAVKMCFKTSEGCMLFDLSYLVENDWWRYVAVENPDEFVLERMEADSLPELMKLWIECFPKEFLVTEEKLSISTFEDELVFPEATLCIRSKTDKQLIGAIVCKLPKAEDELFKNCAWLTALLIKPEYQNKGYGTLLYKAAEEELKRKFVKKVYAGQDLQNFFSGIPAPTEEKIRLFQNLGFVINNDEHYDLKADIILNDKIDCYITTVYDEKYFVETIKKDEYQDLYQFLEEEFPGRWLFTIQEYLEQGGNPENVVVLKNKSDSKIIGFCMVAVNEDKSGGLGPIGIAKSTRGKGIGDFILQQSLLHVRKLGAESIGIDWTILKDFYGKFDFKPIRVYRGAYKEINN